jgi:hypothetical protein
MLLAPGALAMEALNSKVIPFPAVAVSITAAFVIKIRFGSFVYRI